ILETTGENLCLDGRAECHGFIRILRRVELRAFAPVIVAADTNAAARFLKIHAAEPFGGELPDERHTGLTANENHLVEVFRFELRVRQRAQAMLARALNDIPGKALQLRTREFVAETELGREERQGDFHFGFGRKPDFGFLSGFTEAGQDYEAL